MTCDHHKQALLELAAAGAERSAEPDAAVLISQPAALLPQTLSKTSAACSPPSTPCSALSRQRRNSALSYSLLFAQQLQRGVFLPPQAASAGITNPLLWLPAIAAAAIVFFIVEEP